MLRPLLRCTIVGGSGYTGGELLRLLLSHPDAEPVQITSERLAGKPVGRAHPNLRGVTRMKFCSVEELEPCDVLFLCLPHGETAVRWETFSGLAPKIIDLSADFRLRDPAAYTHWYGRPHPRPELAAQFVYGVPELHREAIAAADRVACAGCNATVTLLGLAPLFRAGLARPDRTVVEVKAASSEAGNKHSEGSHHPERSGCLRSFSPTGHRHTAEIQQELAFAGPVTVHFSATAVDLVRGCLATSHVFLKETLTERDIWRVYREAYGQEPFMRMVKEREGIYRFPEPKLLAGTNYCDIGFELAPDGERLVVISAIDNLMKGAAGQAVQCMNLMHGFSEQAGLGFPGLHPV